MCVFWWYPIKDAQTRPKGAVPSWVVVAILHCKVRGGRGVRGEARGHPGLPWKACFKDGVGEPGGCGCVVVCLVLTLNSSESVESGGKQL